MRPHLKKTSMILLLMILVFCGCSIVYISNVTTSALKEQTRNELGNLASVVASQINGDAIAAIRPGDEQTRNFIIARDQLYRLEKSIPDIRYLYVMRRSGNDIEFVVDAEYGIDPNAAPVGQKYPAPSTELVNGFTTVSVDRDFTTDQWGTVLSGYSPVRDSSGAIVGLAGIDMDESRVVAKQNVVAWTSYLIIFLAILMAAFGVIGVERTRSQMVAELKDREIRYHTLFDATNDAILIIRDGVFIDCNNSAMTLFKGTREQIIGKKPGLFLPATQPDGVTSAELFLGMMNAALAGTPQLFEAKQVALDGDTFDAEISLIRIEIDKAIAVQAIIRDITRRKRVEEAIRQSEERYRTLAEASPNAIYILGRNGRITYANPVMTATLNMKLSEILDKRLHDILPGEIADKQTRIINDVMLHGSILRRDDKFTSLNGHGVWLDSIFSPIKSGTGATTSVLIVAHDITDRKAMENQIATSLKEKEFLLKEIHHRVKNNLQVISSLLSMQAKKATDPNVKDSLMDSQNRVKSIALVHEKLYQSKSLDRIEYGDYLNKFVQHLSETFNVNPAVISSHINAEKIYVDINQAVPCSLIINEMMTNSLKYAFPDGREGEITIDFSSDGMNYILKYHDNGIGIPEGVTFDRTQSLGMQLIRGLTRQLDSTVDLQRGDGSTFTVTFPMRQKGR